MILAACLALSLSVPQAPPEPAPIFARIGLVGASITEGFGMQRELGGLADLGDFVAGAIQQPGEVRAFGDVLMFQDPLGKAFKQLEKLARFDPTLVLGVDYLFWFSYGAGLTEEQRLALFDRGLSLLATIAVPLVLGDVPDMSGALEGVSELTGGAFLSPDMIPSAETRATMNARLAAWVAERPHVVVLPLSELLRALHAGEELRVGETVLARAPFEVSTFLQQDLLHTTAKGSALLALASIHLLVEAREDLDAALVTPDVETVGERVRAPLEAKKREREERRRAKEADGAGDGDGEVAGGGMRAAA